MRRLVLGTLVVLSSIAFAPAPAAALPGPGCGLHDRPETGMRGQVPRADQLSGRADLGYNCGLAVVGYNNLNQRGRNGNMAWSGNCAYIAGDGIAVVDASDPTNPRFVRTLRGPGSNDPLETIAAIDAPDRHLLVAGIYGQVGNRGPNGVRPVDIWDTTDCAQPKRLSTAWFPTNVHNLTLSADGRRLFTTLPVQVADISDPRRPKVLGNIEDDLRGQGRFHFQYAHEAVVNGEGTQLYIGGQVLGDTELFVVDIRDWPRRKAKILGRTQLPGHSIRPMTIGGKPYLLHSDESVSTPTAKGCVPSLLTPFGGTAQPYITDISNERAPRAVSQFRLPINEPKRCLTQIADGTNASVHYHDVDDTDRTTFALLSMWNAGLRIVDVRNPQQPREVAYFNPGRFRMRARLPQASLSPLRNLFALQDYLPIDKAWAHTRYDPQTGLIWLTTSTGGFWVLELEPQTRAALGLPAMRAYHPNGDSPRPPASHFTTLTTGSTAMYCTLDVMAGALR